MDRMDSPPWAQASPRPQGQALLEVPANQADPGGHKGTISSTNIVYKINHFHWNLSVHQRGQNIKEEDKHEAKDN